MMTPWLLWNISQNTFPDGQKGVIICVYAQASCSTTSQLRLTDLEQHAIPGAVKDDVVAASSWPPVSLLGAGLDASAVRLSV
jgi:hypothetical protein